MDENKKIVYVFNLDNNGIIKEEYPLVKMTTRKLIYEVEKGKQKSKELNSNVLFSASDKDIARILARYKCCFVTNYYGSNNLGKIYDMRNVYKNLAETKISMNQAYERYMFFKNKYDKFLQYAKDLDIEVDENE